MKGFPKTLGTKVDVENILKNHPEYHGRLKSYLERILAEPDVATRVVSYGTDDKTLEMVDEVIEKIPTPYPLWQRMGFKSREEILAICNRLKVNL